MRAAEPEVPFPEAELRALVDEYRTRCLWFLRPDFYPETRDAALRVLGHIERHGDREGFIRAARMRQTLSRSSNESSSDS